MTRRSRLVTMLVAALLLGLLALAAFRLPVPYVVLSPGPVFNALGDIKGVPVVTIDGARTYASDGTLDVTTVYEVGGPGSRVTLLSAFRSWLDPSATVVPRELLYPDDDTDSQDRQRSVEQMELSQQTAVAAALRHLDRPVETIVAVGSVLADTPADGTLRAGDEFVKVDGRRVHTPGQVRRLISSRAPGESVDLVMRRDDARIALEVGTEASPDDPDRAVVGVIPTLVYVSPVDVTIRLGNVGGPSAGLMFAMTIIDKLTPGALTEGRQVAGTGTIDAHGRVGAIGGVQQKIIGADRQGAELFLMPADNCTEVEQVPEGMTVVPVDTLDDAVEAVGQFTAGQTDDLPSCAA